MTSEPRLTSLAHGGGCGCKLAPGVLSDILARMPVAAQFPDLLVGTETSDDAAVWKLSDDQALVATTDFFMPVVDDPRDFGRIAAANALSDIYAMGGRPILALAIVGMPVNQLSPETIGAILAGGAEVCAEARIPVAGGHSIDSVEPIYGLAVIGLVDPKRLKKNSSAQAEDVLILTKAIGVGMLSAAFKQGKLDEAGYAALIGTTTKLNRIGPDLILNPHVHAMTDVTGFGLLGHALEMARGAGLTAEIEAEAVPLLDGVLDLAREGVRTGASGRNWASYGGSVDLPTGLPDWRRDLLTDPQTSGGLLVSVAPEGAPLVLARAKAAGFPVRSIGRMLAGPARVRVI